ncbi:RagB/SusD family nutrient uptake outer membrane protein [Larkinella sp. VNQ87]|uniref:RagB/SusD family nutrient uptake outer membrane protein n=1 Tax=Larkinella sp. VNQ87 TaxID=3400921 RepID=UPI003C08A805
MKNKLLLSGVLFLGLVVGCQESDLDKLNPNGVTIDTFYKNGAELSSAVNAIYALAKSNPLVSREWFFVHDLRSDDVAAGGGQLETPRNQLLLGSHDTGNSVMSSVWTGFYRLIHRANSTIDLSDKVADIPAETKNRLLAEARFLRAWAYFDLVTMWGNIPLYKNYVTSVEGSLPRSPENEVYDFIIADLKTAQEALPATYDANNLGRATKGAAQMLLARVYLQRADYANAKTELQKIITSGTYALVDEYSDNFLEETEFNKESIWEINFLPSGGNYNWDGDGNGATAGTETVRTQEYSAIGWRNVIPSNSLLNEFEKTATGRDPRFAKSFYVTGDKYNNGNNTLTDAAQNGNSSVVDGQTLKVSWRKFSLMYKTDQSYQTGGINQRIMRYAETLLSMAEVENELGNTAEAVKYLNQVRARKSVNMPPYPTAAFPVTTKDQVFAAIVHERRVELSGEQVRNRDLLRWRKAGKLRTEPFTYFQKNKHELLPIPQQEVDNNPKIEPTDQNPGY